MSTQYYSVAETAKLVRKALKEAFPDVKFSVRSSSYAGGASIGVSWTDGPNEPQVAAITNVFRGSYFDGMTDYQGARYAMIDGQMVRFGADYIHTRRSYSRRQCERVIARYPRVACELTGGREDDCGITGPDFEATRPVLQALYRLSDRLRIRASATAGRVIYCGNDGCSEVGALATDI